MKKLFYAFALAVIFTSVPAHAETILELITRETPASAETLGGTVSTNGSTSMEKVIGYLSEAFEQQHANTHVTYTPAGSSAGITAVLEGRCDIGLSSRELKDEEKATGLNATTVALDGIAVIVNPDNPVSDLSREEIAALYTGKITNWKDMGGNDAPVVLIGREAGSGTRDGFESVTKTRDACKYRQELTSTGDVIATVSRNPEAIGYASLSSVKGNVKPLAVEGVYPSEASIADGSYAIQRPFILVTRKDKALNPVAEAFFAYSVSPEAAKLILSAGAIPNTVK